MLGNSNVHAIVAVKDLAKAKEFYGGTLGLTQINENAGGVMYQSGTSRLFVYPSEYAGTNQANSASWEVDDPAATVEELKSKGITFEHYDNIPGVTLEGDVHVMGSMRAAWFKDPDGNILCLGNAM